MKIHGMGVVVLAVTFSLSAGSSLALESPCAPTKQSSTDKAPAATTAGKGTAPKTDTKTGTKTGTKSPASKGSTGKTNAKPSSK